MEEASEIDIMPELRERAKHAGVRVYKGSDGSDGDALAALFPGRWWSVVRKPTGGYDEHGPFGSETAALLAGISHATKP